MKYWVVVHKPVYVLYKSRESHGEIHSHYIAIKFLRWYSQEKHENAYDLCKQHHSLSYCFELCRDWLHLLQYFRQLDIFM